MRHEVRTNRLKRRKSIRHNVKWAFGGCDVGNELLFFRRIATIAIMLYVSTMAYSASITTSILGSNYADRGTQYFKVTIYGTDTVWCPIWIADAFGGNSKFDGTLYYRWYRSDKDTASFSGAADSVGVVLKYLYGGAVRRFNQSGVIAQPFAVDTTYMFIDSSNKGLQNYRSTSKFAVQKSLYSIGYANTGYDVVQSGYDSTTGSKTYHYRIVMRQHSAAYIAVIGNSYNANRREYAFPIDSSRGSTVEIWLVNTPNDVGSGYQPNSNMFDPPPIHKVNP